MVIFSKIIILLLITIQIDRCSCHAWVNQRCAIDKDPNMPEGIVKNINRFPWLGVVQHAFTIGGKTRYAISSAVLIHSFYAIAAAEDIAKIPVGQIANNTKLYLWGKPNPREVFVMDVKDYILHPQYKSEVTFATLAILSLIGQTAVSYSYVRAPVLPVCLPLSGATTLDQMYAIKMTDETGDLQKQIFKMEHVDSKTCEEFYFQKGLYSERYNPVNPVCAMATYNKTVCVWDAGAALVVQQAYGHWQLVGLSVHGPGCGVPAKFLNIHDYMPWINDIIINYAFSDYSDVYRIGIRRVSPIKLIMFNPEAVPSSLGQCQREDRGNVLYKDWAEFSVNKDFIMGYFFVVVSAIQSVLCGEVELVGATQRSNAAIWTEHNCHADMSGAAVVGQERSGDLRKLNCFVYFKTSAFIEFRFTFSFQVVVSAVLYGTEEKERNILNPFKSTQFTTQWYPTFEKLRGGWFATRVRWWYFQ